MKRNDPTRRGCPLTNDSLIPPKAVPAPAQLLLVDDEPLMLASLCELLKHRDFVLKEASPKVGQIISFNRVGTFKKQLAEVRYLTAEKRCNSIGEERNRQ